MYQTFTHFTPHAREKYVELGKYPSFKKIIMCLLFTLERIPSVSLKWNGMSDRSGAKSGEKKMGMKLQENNG